MPKSEGKKDIPKNVERYVQEGLDAGMDEDKAWAIAWSRYCQYKEPNSPHCKQDEYFPGREKKSSDDFAKVLSKLTDEQIQTLWNGISSGKVETPVFSAFAKEFTKRKMEPITKKASAKKVVSLFLRRRK